jgi:transcription elongation GreA/GreB family factor
MEIKIQLHHLCLSFVQKRIEAAKQAMQAAQESANAEEKSSAGDKYETGRAMSQIARDQAAQQLDEALKLKSALDLINPKLTSTKIVPGSLVITDKNKFYISISAGELAIDGEKYFAISPQSPIGQILIGKIEGQEVSFNKQLFKILQVH